MCILGNAKSMRRQFNVFALLSFASFIAIKKLSSCINLLIIVNEFDINQSIGGLAIASILIL